MAQGFSNALVGRLSQSAQVPLLASGTRLRWGRPARLLAESACGRFVYVSGSPCFTARHGSSSLSLRSCAANAFSRHSSWENAPDYTELQRWDVVGLGQAMVDFAAAVDEDFLEAIDAEKGDRRIITVEERAELIQALDGNQYQVRAGGSLTNTLVALARLGAAEHSLIGQGALRVAMAGIVGTDPLGSFFCAQLRNAGVSIVVEPQVNSNTGTVVVLTTPDANRTMLSYLGSPMELAVDAALESVLSRTRMLVIEGYLWEMPGAASWIMRAIRIARASGASIALTAGDAGLVKRHGPKIWEALKEGADLLFTNRSEAAALIGRSEASAEEAALALGPYSSVVVVTDGANGSYLSALGSLQVVPPFWMADKPVDTCGAGDAYAAGLIFGYLGGLNVRAMATLGARVASAVIGQMGAGLSEEDALLLAAAVIPAADAAIEPATEFGSQ